jgi:hypothetical protein
VTARKSDRIWSAAGIILALAYIAWRNSPFWGPSEDSAEVSADFEGERGESVESEEALTRVTLFALDNDDFREAWEKAVRDYADYLTARIAGARMAARTTGKVRADWAARDNGEPVPIPIPLAIGVADGKAAFELAVQGEVNRRVAAMNGPGAFG